MDGLGHAGPQHPRAPATAGPPPRLAEVGAGRGFVEGQPVLALPVLIDTGLVLALVIRVLAVAP